MSVDPASRIFAVRTSYKIYPSRIPSLSLLGLSDSLSMPRAYGKDRPSLWSWWVSLGFDEPEMFAPARARQPTATQRALPSELPY